MAGNTDTSHETTAEDGHGATDGTHATTEAHGGEHGTGVFPPFDPSTFGSQLLWLALTFAALYFLMSRVALPRIGEILEVRRDRIEGDLAEAERLKQKTDQAIASYEEELAAAKQKAHNIAEETREGIRADLDKKRAKVEADLAKKMASAENNIRETKTAAMAHVEEIASETALAMVTNLVGRSSAKAAKDAVAKVVKG